MLKIEISYSTGRYTRVLPPKIPPALVTEENQQELLEQQRIEEQREEKMRLRIERKREADNRRRGMERPKVSFIPKGLKVDYFLQLKNEGKLPEDV